MHHRIVPSVLAASALYLFAGFQASAQSAHQTARQAEVIQEDSHGVSAPMNTMPVDFGLGRNPVLRARPQIPNVQPVASVDQEDGALQDSAWPMVGTTPGLNILGIGNGFSGFTVQYAPPDTNAAVGATQVVEVVNVAYAVFNKSTGSVVAGPTALQNFWSTVDPSGCGKANNLSDPVVLYDQLAGRWFVEVITVSSPFKFCVAVSQTSDATGVYNAYTFTDTAGLPDYAKTGVWPDAYYLSARQFNASLTSYLGPKACAMDRSMMLVGAAATMQCFLDPSTPTTVDGMLPSTLDGTTAPPAGSPNYFVLLPLPSSGTSTKLQLFKFHVDFLVPLNSTFTGPTVITVPSYTEASSFNGFVPQSGTTTKLDGLGFTLMHRLAYRNFPSATPPHESLVLTHNVVVGTGTTKRYAPRWYEIRSPGTVPAVFQKGSFSPNATYRWAGSIAMDKVGDIALGYTTSSATTHPSIRYTGRVPTDALGTMEAEATILLGTASQTGGLTRWGDYSSMAIDPVDDCTFWYATEYIPVNGSFNWATRLFSFKFTGCQ